MVVTVTGQVYDPGAPLAAYDVHRAMAADLVISTSLHKTLKNILKEQMAYYVRVSGGTRIIIVTNERVLEIVSAPGTPEGFTTNLTLVSGNAPCLLLPLLVAASTPVFFAWLFILTDSPRALAVCLQTSTSCSRTRRPPSRSRSARAPQRRTRTRRRF